MLVYVAFFINLHGNILTKPMQSPAEAKLKGACSSSRWIYLAKQDPITNGRNQRFVFFQDARQVKMVKCLVIFSIFRRFQSFSCLKRITDVEKTFSQGLQRNASFHSIPLKRPGPFSVSQGALGSIQGEVTDLKTVGLGFQRRIPSGSSDFLLFRCVSSRFNVFYRSNRMFLHVL